MFSYFDKNMENFKLFFWNFSLSTGTEIVKSTRRRRGTQSSKIRKKCNSRKCVLLQLLLPQMANIEMFFSKNIHFSMNLPTEFYQIMKLISVKPFFMILISDFYIDIFYIIRALWKKRERGLNIGHFFEKSPFEGLD